MHLRALSMPRWRLALNPSLLQAARRFRTEADAARLWRAFLRGVQRAASWGDHLAELWRRRSPGEGVGIPYGSGRVAFEAQGDCTAWFDDSRGSKTCGPVNEYSSRAVVADPGAESVPLGPGRDVEEVGGGSVNLQARNRYF